jgi:hypothetical protein
MQQTKRATKIQNHKTNKCDALQIRERRSGPERDTQTCCDSCGSSRLVAVLVVAVVVVVLVVVLVVAVVLVIDNCSCCCS